MSNAADNRLTTAIVQQNNADMNACTSYVICVFKIDKEVSLLARVLVKISHRSH